MAPSENDHAPPRNGWEPLREHTAAAADLLMQLSELLAEVMPEDLQRRLAEAVRELLVALRALLDWLVARLQRRPGGPAPVRDIPIV